MLNFCGRRSGTQGVELHYLCWNLTSPLGQSWACDLICILSYFLTFDHGVTCVLEYFCEDNKLRCVKCLQPCLAQQTVNINGLQWWLHLQMWGNPSSGYETNEPVGALVRGAWGEAFLLTCSRRWLSEVPLPFDRGLLYAKDAVSAVGKFPLLMLKIWYFG